MLSQATVFLTKWEPYKSLLAISKHPWRNGIPKGIPPIKLTVYLRLESNRYTINSDYPGPPNQRKKTSMDVFFCARDSVISRV